MLNQSDFRFLAFPFPLWQRGLIALPLASVFGLVLVANSALLLVLICVEALWSPMYVLVGALCIVDLMSTAVIVPNAVIVLLNPAHSISLAECLTQMFLTHFLSSLESTLLLAMALDRYVAICHPLRYRQLVNRWFFLALSVFTLLRSGSVMAVLVALAGSLDFCGSRVIEHLYCDHMALVRLGCGDTGPSRGAGVAVIVCFVGLDIPLITLSYLQILHVVSRAGEDRWKALHTCGTHLMVLLVFYLVGTVAFLSYNLHLGLSPDINTVMGLIYILLPATVNPIIYGVRTAEIRQGFSRVFTRASRVWGWSQTVSSIKVCPQTAATLKGSGPAHKDSGPAHKALGLAHKGLGLAHKGLGLTHKGSGPAHKDSGPAHKGSGPTYKDSGLTNKGLGPAHKGSGPAHKGSGPTHKDSGLTHKGLGLAHKGSGTAHKGSGPTHKDSGPAHKDSSPTHCCSGPTHRGTTATVKQIFLN